MLILHGSHTRPLAARDVAHTYMQKPRVATTMGYLCGCGALGSIQWHSTNAERRAAAVQSPAGLFRLGGGGGAVFIRFNRNARLIHI